MGVPLGVVLREWGRIGCIGFGGPPAHVALLRELTVERRKWLDAREFEDANAACGLLPGPASTQLAIYCAQRVAGLPGAMIGGAAFILPGLAMVLVLAAVALGSAPPSWILGLGAGAGAAVVAVVVQAGFGFARAALQDRHGALLWRGGAYLVTGAVATVLAGPWVVLVLLGCGLVELAIRGRPGPLLNLGPVAWTAFKVGALSYGGGLVIIPLMQADAVERYGWMSRREFLDAVAFGQLTPGPVVQTVPASATPRTASRAGCSPARSPSRRRSHRRPRGLALRAPALQPDGSRLPRRRRTRRRGRHLRSGRPARRRHRGVVAAGGARRGGRRARHPARRPGAGARGRSRGRGAGRPRRRPAGALTRSRRKGRETRPGTLLP
jgi:chromate transport protein ChrA